MKAIKNLNVREKIIVIAAAVFIVSLVIFSYIISPALERSKLLGRLIAQKEREYHELLFVKEQYRRLKAAEDEIVKQLSDGNGDVSPLSQLEQLAKRAGISGQIEQMKPLSPITTPRYIITPVQLRFKGAGLKEVTSYLYEIETAPVPFRVKRFKIRSMARPAGGLDVSLEVLTFSTSGSK